MGDFMDTKWSVSSITVFAGSGAGVCAGAGVLASVFDSTVILVDGFSESGEVNSFGFLDILTLCPQPEISSSPISDSSTNFINFLIFDTHITVPSSLRV